MSTMILIELVFALVFLVPVSIYAIASVFDYLMPRHTIRHGFVWMPRFWTVGVIWYPTEDGGANIAINVLPTIQYVLAIRKRE